MPDSIVRTQLVVVGGPAALAQLQAYRAELTGIGAASAASTRLNIDSSAVRAATTDVASLGSAHAALGGKTAVLGMDVSAVEQARTSVKGMQGDIISLASTIQTATPILALGTAVAGVTAFAAQYQTMLTQTANQTTLTTAEIGTMDKAIRSLPTGNASLQDIATGFKNITDLGYSAADATKIAAEEAKAATATGASQASVMLAVTSAMKEYNAAASDVASYTNIIAEAAKLGNTSFQAWTEGTRTGTAYAAAFGVSLQEADAFMVALTRHGFDASEASTQLRGVIQHIVADPKAAAQQTIANVKQATGIDLTPDFGPDAIKTQGLTKIMQDLHDVTIKTGNEAYVNSLIPALRGGTGAIITITQAYNDSTQALNLLGQAATGAIDPVDEGFNRISQTAGYQFGQAMKQLKFDMIDLGATFLPVATGIIEDFEKIPAGAVKAAAEVGLAFAAIKTATAVGGLIDTGINAARGLLGGGAADTAATTAQSAATDAAAASTATLTAALAANTEATIANTAATGENAAVHAGLGGAFQTEMIARETVAVEAETVAIGEQTAVMDAATTSRKAFTAAALASNLAIAAGLAYGAQQLDQAMIAPDVKNLAARQLQDINKSLSNGQSTIDQQIAEQTARAASMKQANDKGPFGIPNPDIPGVGRPFPTGLTPVDAVGSNGYSDTQIQAQQEVVRQLQARKQREDAAAQVSAIKEASAPADTSEQTGLPSKAVTTANAADAKAFAANQAAYEKALFNDVAKARTDAQAAAVKAQKDSIQEAADAQVAAATKSADAWKAANAEVGRVDISKGLAALGDAAPALDKARDTLAAMGKGDAALSNLAGIADVFKGFDGEVDKASAAMKGFDLTLQQTNDAMKAIGSLKSEYLAALDAAEKRVANGTADSSDLQIINMRSSALSTLDQQTSKLQQAGNVDLIGKLTNLPDYAALDEHLRSIVASNGGGAGIIAKVNLDKLTAESDLTKFEQQDRAAIVQIKADTKDAIANVDKFLAGIPSDKTVTIHTVTQDAPGSASTAQGNDGIGGAGGATQTPRGDAANLMPYADLIQSAAAAYGVPAWVLGAIIEHESGGTVGAVQKGGLGRGLTQVDIGQNPQYDESKLTGTSRGDAAYQINSGAEILANFLKQYGGDFQKALQNYAGPAYQSQEGGGVPAGLPLPEELQRYYRAPVEAALTPYSSTPEGGIGSGGGTGFRAADAALGIGNQFSDLPPTQGATSTPAIIAEARKSIGEKLDRFGKDVYGKCEEIVDDIVQNATGKDTRFLTADAHVRAAMAGQAGAGTVVSRANARPGDLVGWTGDSQYAGDPAGHIGVYSGGNNYIGTTTNGVQERPLGPDAIFIRPDGVVAGGPVAGAILYTGKGSVSPTSQAAKAASAPPGSIPNINGTQGGAPIPAVIPPDFSKAASDLAAALGKLDPAALKDAGQQFASILPALTTAQGKSLYGPDGPQTTTEKQTALNAATQQGLAYETAYAQLVYDVEHHTGNIAADTQKVADIVGGPMADGYAKAALASAQMATGQADITRLQKEQTDAADKHQQEVNQRTADDQAAARKKQQDSWTTAEDNAQIARYQQGIQAGWAQDAIRLAARTTTEARGYQDAGTATDRAHQLAAREFADQLTSINKIALANSVGNTTQAEVFAGRAAGAGTLADKRLAAENLAIQKEYDNRAHDTINSQLDGLKREQLQESRNYEDAKYNRDKAHTQATRNLQDEATRAQNNHTALTNQWNSEAFQRAETARQQTIDDTKAQWRLQDLRLSQDVTYQAAKDANKDAQTAAQGRVTAAQSELDLAKQAETVFKDTGAAIALLPAQLSIAAQAALGQSTAPPTNSMPGYHRALGAYAEGGIVGDSPDGDMSTAEAVFGNYTVVPHAQSVAMGLVPATPIRDMSAQNGGTALPITINAPITVNGTTDIEATVRAILAPIEAQVRRALAQSTRPAMGAGRVAG